MTDGWTLVISGAIVALITYALPKVIEGVFRRRVTINEAEAAQESIETLRWKKAQDDIVELIKENHRLRELLRRHNIDPSGSGPMNTDKPHGDNR